MRGSGAFRSGAAPGGALAPRWSKDRLWRAARATPSLDLNFADSKSLTDGVTGQNLVTFTRASSGTFVGSDGVLRTATTNLLLRSEEFGTTWSQYLLSSVTANTTIAPNGETTADTIAYTADAFADINQNTAFIVNGLTYTLSVWARSVSGTSAFRFKYWNGATGVYSSANTVTETWQRFTYTFTATATAAGANVGLANTTAAARSVVFWGAQLEQSSTVGEYIPTTSTINSAPRFDHNPLTGESLGLLVEEARTNLQPNSGVLTANTWGTTATTIAASGTGPDGATAYELSEDTTSSVHTFFAKGGTTDASTSVVSGTSYAGSIFLKRSTVDWVQLTFGAVGFTNRFANFNLATGAIGTTSNVTATIQAFPGGWYKCSITGTATATANSNNILIGFTNNTDSATRLPSYTGSTSNKVLAALGQFEAGSFPTSYIPTTSATATRSADVASISGSNFARTRTNLLVRSEDFDNASWTKTGATVSQNVTAAPNGTLTADTLVVANGTGVGTGIAVQDASGALADTTYTISLHVKSAGLNTIRIQLGTRTSGSAFIGEIRYVFNLTAATASFFASSGTVPVNPSAAITAIGNGWYRVSITATTTATTAIVRCGILNDVIGNGTDGISVWGAQLETSSIATPYIPSPSVFVSRASSATYIDSNRVLRSAATNLLLRSEEFDNAVWGPISGTVSANQTVAPSGAATADKLIAPNGGSQGQIFQGLTITSGSTVTGSVYAKGSGLDRLELVLLSNNNTTPYGRSVFNPNTGAVTTAAFAQNGGTNASSNVQVLGNDWYRFSVTVTYPAVTAAGIRVSVFNADSSNGDGVKGVFLWGAQLEQSSTVGDYVPTTTTINSAARYDFDPTTGTPKGLLLEEARTNSIRNNTMVGAVAGTPGTLPTNWVYEGAGLGTLSQQVVGAGVVNGINYIDLRIFGTTSSPNLPISFESRSAAAAASGQTWTISAYLAIAGGSISNINAFYFRQVGRTSAGATAENIAGVDLKGLLASAVTRYSSTSTLTNATTAFNQPQVVMEFNSGVAIDITLRIGLPQLELGAFATSAILTSGTAATRSADVSTSAATTVTDASWYRQDEGTVFAEARVQDFTVTTFPRIASLDRGDTSTNFIALVRTSTTSKIEYSVFSSGTGQAVGLRPDVTFATGSTARTALVYKADDFIAAANGVLSTADTSGSLPTSLTTLGIGMQGNGSLFYNGTLRRLTFFPQRLPNTTLQAITQ